MRLQLKRTAIEVIELVPPHVQTELGGPAQATDPNAMPLEAFVAEVFEILERKPPVEEILVKRVYGHRFAAENEREAYDAFFQRYNARFTFGSARKVVGVDS